MSVEHHPPIPQLHLLLDVGLMKIVDFRFHRFQILLFFEVADFLLSYFIVHHLMELWIFI
jgi:hypothetical protein